jgi:DNA-directed RNA polymerase subunit RPC12/RpoP
MTGLHRREVRCEKCGWWWHHPREPIHFASWDEWAEEHQKRETLACPNCGVRTEVSEGNVRFSKHTPEKDSGKKGTRAGKK